MIYFNSTLNGIKILALKYYFETEKGLFMVYLFFINN